MAGTNFRATLDSSESLALLGRNRREIEDDASLPHIIRSCQIGMPFEIREAIVEACGKAFWLKDPLKSLMRSAGVPTEMYERYAELSKFKITRNVLEDLDGLGEEGWKVQRRLLTELCRLRKLPDETVPNPDAGIRALRALKRLASEQKLVALQEEAEQQSRVRQAQQKQQAVAARAERVRHLRLRFQDLVMNTEAPQTRGYSLEDLLAELFELNELAYRRSYRTATEQIDGHFEFKGFDYLVEARWRRDQPTESDLAGFKGKVDRKLQSTRGLFVSIPGFRPEVVAGLTHGTTSSLVLMDGQDISLILEGLVTLRDALELKIQKAAQEGIAFFQLASKFHTS